MHAEAGQPVTTEKLEKPPRPSCMCTPAEPKRTGQPVTLTSSGAARPTAAARKKLPVVLLTAPAVMLGSVAVPAAESAAATSGESVGRTERLKCVRARAATLTPGSGKTAAVAPLMTNSSAAPPPPVAVRRARVWAL